MTTPKSSGHYHLVACQVCGSFIQPDPSLDAIDEQQIVKTGCGSSANIDESYNEIQQGGVCMITKGSMKSQSSLDSANDFAFVANELTKGYEEKSMREHRNDINKIFDYLSEQYIFDHPLCQDCTDTLLDKLDNDLQMATHELTSYKKLLEQLNSTTYNDEEYESLQKELRDVYDEEKKLKDELIELEQEHNRVKQETDECTREEQLLELEEIKYLREYNEYKRLLFEAEDEQKSIDNQIKHARAQFDKLTKTNAFNAAFHIWHQEHFGTINGFRLGRLPSINVEWSEINAALGQAALLLHSLAKRIDLQFNKYKIVPFGSHSFIEELNEKKNGKPAQLPLYTVKRHFTWDGPFDQAMIAFLDCLNQLKQAIETKNHRFCLPYKMNNKGLITDSNGQSFNVRSQVSSPEQWTKALKYFLTNLKWGLTWITSQLPDDMTTNTTEIKQT
ncbi:unnamed protein product [Didymodactylos carnosus]|uniref:Autophagy-related protein 6 n=1 Tax=Didymodactylos carnosus TaxID=1234261 RepID=A0A815CFS8_9BILA|nr:unnamed protein product [Didymodactylos carnosus]CAF1282289.1 unnamed protein product [Didymodactylos carnosus]CAF3530681.1 unnamed protein product [Didymodactylos carnosus]CAF4078524.1 unnamed protein product [Didymodactylos carnosus]